MITIVEGDLFKTNAGIICHSVNCKGVMGSGVALQVKHKYPSVYKHYKEFCDDFEMSNAMLGSVLVSDRNNKGEYIYNLFAQDNYGYDGKCYTSYESLQKCFDTIVANTDKNEAIAMPYLMGCHRGGGDWERVYKMIEDTFLERNVILYKRGE